MRYAYCIGMTFFATSTAAGCFSAAPASEPLGETPHTGCELTLQASSTIGECGQLTLVNTGNEAMAGWTVEFNLPDGGTLTSGWNASFSESGGTETIQPLADQNTINPGQSVSLGYCTSSPAGSLSLIAGSCAGSAAGTAVLAIDANDNANSTTVTFGPALSVNQNVSCDLNANNVVMGPNGAYNIGSVGKTCGAAVSTAAYGLGVYSVNMQAANGPGLVTSFGTAADLLPAINMEVQGASPGTVVMTVFVKGIRSATVTKSLGFDATAAAHAYAFVQTATTVTFSVDHTSVWTTPCNRSANAVATILLSTTQDGTAPAPSQRVNAWFGDVLYTP